MVQSDSSSDEGGLENFVIDANPDWEAVLRSMPEDVESAYRDTYSDARCLRRNSTGNSWRIEGGLSPLPPRRGAQTSEDDTGVLADLRPHSAADLNCFFPTEPFPFSTPEDELPLPNRVEPLDVALTEDDLRREQDCPPEQDLQPHPFTLTQASSFDSTAALTDSPHAPSLTPLSVEAPCTSEAWTKATSHLDHTLPQNIHEIQDTQDTEKSDAQKATTALRCETGAAISGSTTAGNYVQKIVEENPREAQRRPTPVPEKPLIKRGLFLASIFTGVAILVGRIFTARGA